MNLWIGLGIGLLTGAFFGIVVMCLCTVSGKESRREEKRETRPKSN